MTIVAAPHGAHSVTSSFVIYRAIVDGTENKYQTRPGAFKRTVSVKIRAAKIKPASWASQLTVILGKFR